MTVTAALLVERLAADIAEGRLKPGDRLPPQRTFAYERGIATSTASRIYGELLKRGLVVGEVGRGTFVAGRNPGGHATAEPTDGRIDLEFNFPVVEGQGTLLARALAAFARSETLEAAFGPVTQGALAAARDIAAGYLATPQWQPPASGIVFTGSGRQAIAAAISTVVPMGGRLAVEALTYPLVKNIAARLGVSLVPIAMDGDGPLPAALARAHRATPFTAVYLQPVLHNPLGHTISVARCADIAALTAKLGVHLIEDHIFGFLSDAAPLAVRAPERAIVVDSLSKRVSPGVGLGIIHAPAPLRDRLAASVRAGAWSLSPFALQFGTRLLADGTAHEIVRLKRADAPARHAIVTAGLPGAKLRASPEAYHAWLELPEGWRAETFAAAAARDGIALTPAAAFATAPGHAPNAVRLALGQPPHAVLAEAMSRVSRLLAALPDETERTE